VLSAVQHREIFVQIVFVAPLPKTLSVQGVDLGIRVISNPTHILESISHLGSKLKGFVSNSRPKYNRAYPSRTVSNDLGFHIANRRDTDIFSRVELSNILSRIAHAIQ
jgi:uncharacterized membrane protein